MPKSTMLPSSPTVQQIAIWSTFFAHSSTRPRTTTASTALAIVVIRLFLATTRMAPSTDRGIETSAATISQRSGPSAPCA